MTKDEARQLLEENDYCMRHLVRQQQEKGSRKLVCPDCEAEKAAEKQVQLDEAVRLLRGEAPLPPAHVEHWTACEQGKLPPVNERVYFMVVGFRDSGSRGGRENYVTGKPLFWRRKN